MSFDSISLISYPTLGNLFDDLEPEFQPHFKTPVPDALPSEQVGSTAPNPDIQRRTYTPRPFIWNPSPAPIKDSPMILPFRISGSCPEKSLLEHTWVPFPVQAPVFELPTPYSPFPAPSVHLAPSVQQAPSVHLAPSAHPAPLAQPAPSVHLAPSVQQAPSVRPAFLVQRASLMHPVYPLVESPPPLAGSLTSLETPMQTTASTSLSLIKNFTSKALAPNREKPLLGRFRLPAHMISDNMTLKNKLEDKIRWFKHNFPKGSNPIYFKNTPFKVPYKPTSLVFSIQKSSNLVHHLLTLSGWESSHPLSLSEISIDIMSKSTQPIRKRKVLENSKTILLIASQFFQMGHNTPRANINDHLQIHLNFLNEYHRQKLA